MWWDDDDNDNGARCASDVESRWETHFMSLLNRLWQFTSTAMRSSSTGSIETWTCVAVEASIFIMEGAAWSRIQLNEPCWKLKISTVWQKVESACQFLDGTVGPFLPGRFGEIPIIRWSGCKYRFMWYCCRRVIASCRCQRSHHVRWSTHKETFTFWLLIIHNKHIIIK